MSVSSFFAPAAVDSSPLGKQDAATAETPKVSGAEARAAQKEINQIDRKLAKLADQKNALAEKMVAHNQSDYTGLADLGAQQQSLQDEIEELEMRWMELSDLVS